MLPFRELDCPVLEQIQQEALEYIKTKTNLLESSDKFWNPVDVCDFLKYNRTLFKYCLSLKLAINDVAVLVVYDGTTDVSLHVDHAPLVCKVNFPILNTFGTKTQWYHVPEALFAAAPTFTNPFGVELPDLQYLDLNDLELVGEVVNQDTPIVFNSAMPHTVLIEDTARYPRVMLSCMFREQPIHMLEK